MTKEQREQLELENKILELIDFRDEVTRSDLQGLVTALAMKYKRKES